MNTPFTTIGLLYAGDMGAAVAQVIRANGARVVSTFAGRSRATAQRCQQAQIELLPSTQDVIRQSQVILSCVPPAAAEEVARDFCRCADFAPAGTIYVDLNSISPEQSQALAETITRTGRHYVDGAINGLAKNLTTSGTILLSGPRAAEIAPLFTGASRIRVLGSNVGAASAMKMLLAGLSKGLCGLFAELALIAQQHDMLEAFAQTSTEIYSGMMLVVERMLPTYAQHAARRATEMQELEATAHAAGLNPPVITAVRQLHEMLASATYEPTETVASLIQRLDQQNIARATALCPELVSGEKASR
jgi:3-hydroxyisobutyrate dehydrogenase-like beta-hydroxyacid dehydrogenase